MRRRLLLTIPAMLALAGCQGALDSLGLGGTQRFVVFFGGDSAALGPAAQAIVAQAAEAARGRPNVPVRVAGFASPNTGTAQVNLAVSEQRARAVTDALVQHGVAQSRITLQPRGAVPFEAYPTESRRVDIEIGG